VEVAYKVGRTTQKEHSLATLQLIIESENGVRTRLRWPVIDGQASGTLFLPDSLPRRKHTILAALQQRFFEVIGEVKNARNIGTIQAMLLTKTGEWVEQEVPVAPDGSFAIRNWLFEDNALLAFYNPQRTDGSLDISISTQLDSSASPLAVAGRTFYIGNPPADVRKTLDKRVETAEALFADRGTLLPAVTVRATARSRAEQFNAEHVSGLFRSSNERLISVLDDPSAPGFNNIFNYLQGRVAGLQIAPT